MQHTHFTTTLISEIHELNQSFVELMLRAYRGGDFALDPVLAKALDQPDRVLPQCPFLLFRPVERADDDVSVVLRANDDFAQGLVVATLTLLRQLAREDLPTVRLLTGESVRWCRTLAALTPSELVRLAPRLDLKPRLVDVSGFWQDLVRARGVSRLQRASLGATGLQLVLSRPRRFVPIDAFRSQSGFRPEVHDES
ncbi:MAG: hypothetical protein AAFN07_00385 [Pseudomonadota bacterium]